MIFDNLFNTGDNLFFTIPSGITVLPHAGWFDNVSGSLNRIAVAGTVLSIKNVPGSDDEYTAKIVAPVNSDERKVTSEPTSTF